MPLAPSRRLFAVLVLVWMALLIGYGLGWADTPEDETVHREIEIRNAGDEEREVPLVIRYEGELLIDRTAVLGPNETTTYVVERTGDYSISVETDRQHRYAGFRVQEACVGAVTARYTVDQSGISRVALTERGGDCRTSTAEYYRTKHHDVILRNVDDSSRNVSLLVRRNGTLVHEERYLIEPGENAEVFNAVRPGNYTATVVAGDLRSRNRFTVHPYCGGFSLAVHEIAADGIESRTASDGNVCD